MDLNEIWRHILALDRGQSIKISNVLKIQDGGGQKKNSQSNGKGKVPRVSKTLEQILMKPSIHNYVAGMTTDANPCGTATTWVVSANTRHIICFGFISDLFSFLLYSWDCAATPPVD